MKNFINTNALLGLIQGVIIALFIRFESDDAVNKVLLVTSTLSVWGALLFVQLSPLLMTKNASPPWRSWCLLIGYFTLFGVFGYCFLEGTKSSYQAFWGLTLVVGGYLVLPFVQLASRGETSVSSWTGEHYHSIFSHAWCNAILVIFGYLTAVVVWLVLALWWELFEVIGIDFFEKLFTNKWFAWPVLGTVFGVGIHAAQHHFHIIDNLKRLLLSMCSLLLPLVTLLTLSFITSVAFTGLDSVWGTGVATPLILVLVFINILLINGASLPQSDEPRLALPSNKLWRTLVYINIAALTVLMAIAAYSSYLRIDQYGWTVSRVYLALMVTIMAFYTLAYLGLLRDRGNNFNWLKRSNVFATWSVIGLLVISHNPWVNPISATINSQLSRLDQQQISVENFSYELFYFELGQRGKDALDEYVASTTHPERDVITQYFTALQTASDRYDWLSVKDELTAKPYQFEWIGESLMSDEQVIKLINKEGFYRANCRELPCHLIAMNMDYDNDLEVLLLKSDDADIYLFDTQNARWFNGGVVNVGYEKDRMNNIIAMFESQRVLAKPTRYKALEIDGKLFDVSAKPIPPSLKPATPLTMTDESANSFVIAEE